MLTTSKRLAPGWASPPSTSSVISTVKPRAPVMPAIRAEVAGKECHASAYGPLPLTRRTSGTQVVPSSEVAVPASSGEGVCGSFLDGQASRRPNGTRRPHYAADGEALTTEVEFASHRGRCGDPEAGASQIRSFQRCATMDRAGTPLRDRTFNARGKDEPPPSGARRCPDRGLRRNGSRGHHGRR
jgi:hypothetical protein